MSEFATETLLVGGVLMAFFVGPGLAIAFLLLRKATRRARRRSPIGINLLRGPGHSLRDEIEEVANDLQGDMLILAVFPLIFLALFLAQAHVKGLGQMARFVPMYVVLVVAVLAVVIWKMLKKGERLDQLRAGYDAELAVGQELDQLMRRGAVVFHDFPAENFNIDHVVVSSHGLIAVETKGYTKDRKRKGKEAATVVFDGQVLRFPTWKTHEPLEQAERQAKWLAAWASSAVGERVNARAVLALPGWFVKRIASGPVEIFSGRELAALFAKVKSDQLTNAQVKRIAHQIDQRCRTVVPTYGRGQNKAN